MCIIRQDVRDNVDIGGKANDHLQNLNRRDAKGNPFRKLKQFLNDNAILEIHDSVNEGIHRNLKSATRSERERTLPRKDKHGCMMKPVQKINRLLRHY